MKINDYNLKVLIDAIKDSLTGSQWVDLLVGVGFKDIYDDYGLPDIGKAKGQRPSKKEYLRKRLSEINGQAQMRVFLEKLLNSHPEIIMAVTDNIKDDGYQINADTGGHLFVAGAVLPDQRPVKTEAHFHNLEKQVISALDRARVSIRVAMAWFTNQRIADKLIEKHREGVDVKVILYDDHTNAKYGVNLSDIPHKCIRATRGGTMHDKFCVIDNQFVITGSYNWSDNAENKNDENSAVLYDRERASDYSVEFRRLYSSE